VVVAVTAWWLRLRAYGVVGAVAAWWLRLRAYGVVGAVAAWWVRLRAYGVVRAVAARWVRLRAYGVVGAVRSVVGVEGLCLPDWVLAGSLVVDVDFGHTEPQGGVMSGGASLRDAWEAGGLGARGFGREVGT
jgi:hypothetical protein